MMRSFPWLLEPYGRFSAVGSVTAMSPRTPAVLRPAATRSRGRHVSIEK